MTSTKFLGASAQILAFAFLCFSANAQEVSAWKNNMDVACEGGLFKCLTSAEMEAIKGKTLKFRHSRFQKFGYVRMKLKAGNVLEAGNDTGRSYGSWEMKGNTISFKFVTQGWTDFTADLVSIDSQLFLSFFRDQGSAMLYPISVIAD